MKETENHCSDVLKKVEEQIMWVDKDAVNNRDKRLEKWESRRNSVYQIRELLRKGLVPISIVKQITTNINNQLP